MRVAFAFMLSTAIFSSAAHAGNTVTEFEGIQERCAQVGDISFGPKGRWPACRVTQAGWVATVGILDIYQAQYCLGASDAECGERALLLFGNRAYTPEAHLLVQRIDPGATRYDDPLLVETPYGTLMALEARSPGGSENNSYHLWQKGRWMPIDSKAWLRDLSKRLPKGLSAGEGVAPDIDRMRVQVPLYRSGENAGIVAEVELGLAKNRFTLTKLTLAHE
ncbi:MAG: hypothetical protein HYU75_24840 [Betaproteobacteria bacterium]|nr:hypothetical protein [Betaproteobacteria bacterium]